MFKYEEINMSRNGGGGSDASNSLWPSWYLWPTGGDGPPPPSLPAVGGKGGLLWPYTVDR